MSHSHIVVRGARTHNLQNLDVDVPRGRFVVFAGVSGSGKSSLVFATLAAEAGRQLNETFPPFTRNRLPRWTRPDVDAINGLSPVVVIDQRRLGGNARSTVGTATDAWTYLRLIYSRLSEPHVGESTRFSFNTPAGMCPTCAGLGETVVGDVDAFLRPDRSLADGGIALPGFGRGQYWYRRHSAAFDTTVPLRDWTEADRQRLLFGDDGLLAHFERVYLHTADNLSDRKREILDRFTRTDVCPDCAGDRLAPEPRAATVAGRTIGELSRMEITELAAFVDGLDDDTVAPAVISLRERLAAMITVGLGYLTLARGTSTLSGGESQRVKMVTHLGSSLTEMTYVIDEPSVGLHPHDVASMTELLADLRDDGNTVLVVEHDATVMARADHIVEIGPDGGSGGGRLVFSGAFDALRRADTPTGHALRTAARAPTSDRVPRGRIEIRSASRNNLRDVDVTIELGLLTAFTGVAGSGKSSLAAEFIAQHDAVVVDQRPVATNRRSTPITYTGIAPGIRKLFARSSGLPVAMFSANSDGGCPACNGLGLVYTDLAFLEGQETVCEECAGRRYRPESLNHRVGGLSIADVDGLTVSEAARVFPTESARLTPLAEVGLGYLRLGQSLNTLSGGECQRVKIARELHRRSAPAVYVLDEPTSGLHRRDVEVLLDVFDRLLDQGHTVVVVEHDMDVVAHADRIVDLGPGPGRHGGRVVFAGCTVDYLDAPTPTSRALRTRVS